MSAQRASDRAAVNPTAADLMSGASRVGESGARARPDETLSAMSSMFGRDSLYMVVLALQLVVAVVLVPVITRVLGPAGYGRIATAVAISQAIFPAAALGLQLGIQRVFAGARGPERARGLLAVSMVLAALVVLVLVATGNWWSRALGLGAFSPLLLLTVVWSGLVAVTYANLALLRSLERLGQYATVSLLQSVGIQLVALAAVLTVRRTPEVFVAGYVVGQAVALVVGLTLARPRLGGLLDHRVAIGALAFSIPLVPQQISTFVLNASDRLIVQRDLGAVATGRYQVAYNVGGLAIILLSFVNQAWMPRIFALQEPARSAVLARSRDQIYAMLVPVIVGMAIGLPAVLQLWAPAGYHPATLTSVTVLVVVSTVAYAASLGPVRILLATGRTRSLAVATTLAALTNIGLNLVLVPAWGINGSAAATVISYAILAVAVWAVSRSALRLPTVPLGIAARLLAAIAVAAVSAAVPTAAPWFAVRIGVAVMALAWFAHGIRAIVGTEGGSAPQAPVTRKGPYTPQHLRTTEGHRELTSQR